MGIHEKSISVTPPAPIAKTVLAHRRILEAERDALKTGGAELAFKSVGGDLEARAALRAMPGLFAALQFEIDQNHAAHELAVKYDSDAEIAWRASLQELPPEEIIRGIDADQCPRLCQQGIAGGCCLTGGAPYAGSTCWHPTRFGSLHQFNVDTAGKRIFPHRRHDRASKVFDVACDTIGPKVRGKFSNE